MAKSGQNWTRLLVLVAGCVLVCGAVGWAQSVGGEVWEKPGPTDPERWNPQKNMMHIDPVRVVGTRLYVRPPLYYEALEDAPGYRHESKEIEITITEMPTALGLITEGWMTEDRIRRRGIQETGRENLIVNRLPGLLVRGNWDTDPQGRRGILFAAFGVGFESVLVQARYAEEEAEEARSAVVWLLTGSMWDIREPISPLAPLPFRFEIPEGWGVTRRVQADVLLQPLDQIEGGTEMTEEEAAAVRAAHGLSHPESARIDAYGRTMYSLLTDPLGSTEETAKLISTLDEITIDTSAMLIQDGVTACIVNGRGLDERTGDPVQFVLLALYAEERRFVITGIVHEDDAAAGLPVLDRVVTSLHRLRQSEMEPLTAEGFEALMTPREMPKEAPGVWVPEGLEGEDGG